MPKNSPGNVITCGSASEGNILFPDIVHLYFIASCIQFVLGGLRSKAGPTVVRRKGGENNCTEGS